MTSVEILPTARPETRRRRVQAELSLDASVDPDMPSLRAFGQPRVRYGMGEEIVFRKLKTDPQGAGNLKGSNVLIVPGFSSPLLVRTVLRNPHGLPRFRFSKNSEPRPGGRTYLGDADVELRARGISAKMLEMPGLEVIGPGRLGRSVKAALLSHKKPITLIGHSYGFTPCMEALVSLTPEERRGIRVVFHRPTIGGCPLSMGWAFGIFPLTRIPLGGLQATRPDKAREYMRRRLPRILDVVGSVPTSVILGSAPQSELSDEWILWLIQAGAGFPRGIRDVAGPNQCPWNDGYVFIDQSSLPCAKVAHYWTNGTHVPFLRPKSPELDELINSWGTVARPYAF